jgi:hypothetical protein
VEDFDKAKINSLLGCRTLENVKKIITFEAEPNYKSSAIRFACAERSVEIVHELIKFFPIPQKKEIISEKHF